jgi:hypothetical protein
MATGGSFEGVKRPRHEVDHAPPPGAEINTCGALPQSLHMYLRHGVKLSTGTTLNYVVGRLHLNAGSYRDS